MQVQWKSLGLALMMVSFAGCASHETKEKLDNQVKAEPASQGAVAQQMNDKLMNNPNLNEKQKSDLQALREKARSEITEARNEYRQTQSLLVQKLADPKATLSEVDYLRQKMKKLGYKQTDIALNSVTKAAEIVGKKAPLEEDFYQPFLEPDGVSPSMQPR